MTASASLFRNGLWLWFLRDVESVAVIIFILLIEFDFLQISRYDFMGCVTVAKFFEKARMALQERLIIVF